MVLGELILGGILIGVAARSHRRKHEKRYWREQAMRAEVNNAAIGAYATTLAARQGQAPPIAVQVPQPVPRPVPQAVAVPVPVPVGIPVPMGQPMMSPRYQQPMMYQQPMTPTATAPPMTPRMYPQLQHHMMAAVPMQQQFPAASAPMYTNASPVSPPPPMNVPMNSTGGYFHPDFLVPDTDLRQI